METRNPDELQAIKRAIPTARTWAKLHFNHAHWETATLLDAPAFRVTFPDVDTMHVEPYLCGVAMKTCVMDYRLRFHKDGRVTWRPAYKLLGEWPELVVTVVDGVQTADNLTRR